MFAKAKIKLNSSRSKQEIFEELQSEFDEKPSSIAAALRYTPTKTVRNKYRILQVTTLILLLSLFLVQVLHYQAGHYQNVSTMGIVIRVLVALFIFGGVVSYSGVMFMVTAIFAFTNGFRLITNVGLDNFVTLDFVDIGLSLLLVALGIFLRLKLESKYEEVIIEEKDEDGVLQKVSKIVFIEDKANRNDILD
jgi:hypothetical protein